MKLWTVILHRSLRTVWAQVFASNGAEAARKGYEVMALEGAVVLVVQRSHSPYRHQYPVSKDRTGTVRVGRARKIGYSL